PINDIDGNVYNTVTIGTQVWMAENLKTTRYNDGTEIPNITDNAEWKALTTPAYCWYNNNAGTYKSTYGALYNWYTVDVAGNGGKNVCPTGWHIPTDAEWTTLTTYLGGLGVAGDRLKETGTTHWRPTNWYATNESGFTALPGGCRTSYGAFIYVGNYGGWWSSDAYWQKIVYTSNMYGSLRDNNNDGFSLRCVRDF
ncbi:MAG: fibrobacter succinogenes major paralogous domain-containing protein, partial [Mobilitalea sp.]